MSSDVVAATATNSKLCSPSVATERAVHFVHKSSLEDSPASNSSSCSSSGRMSPIGNGDDDSNASSLTPVMEPSCAPNSLVATTNGVRRHRTVSGSAADDVVLRRKNNKLVYTAGRPPWYDCHGTQLREPFIIGICGGSASGKTTVAKTIIELLDIPWVTLLSMDSFYKVLDEQKHQLASLNEYDFDHPDAFDYELLLKTLQRLKEGKCVDVPIYNFTTHSREKHHKTMYGASVLIFEGILAFHNKEVVDMMDLKIFVDTDADTRLARRLHRDICERGREVDGVLKQYARFVKPSFDSFIAPSMRYADIIIPRGGENCVAIDLIGRHIKGRLREREADNRAQLVAASSLNGKTLGINSSLPPTLYLIKQTPQLRGLHTVIRNAHTSRNEFIFYSNRVMRLLIEHALSLLPFEEVEVTTPTKQRYVGKRRKAEKICGVSILRAGEAMESALREVLKDCTVSKILIQTNPETMEPELYYLRLPKDIHRYQILLMDTTVATGAAAMMGIRILLEHDVAEENIILLSLIMSEIGVNSVAYAFPKVKLVTSAVDHELSSKYHILPGIGNFGDRYFGTETDEASFGDSDIEDDDVNNNFTSGDVDEL